jgi:hypothetical protein
MARMPHEKADARHAAYSAIGVVLARYRRRLAQAAEDFISVEYDKAIAAGLPFDAEAVALAAVKHAEAMYVTDELPAPAAIEVLDAAPTA